MGDKMTKLYVQRVGDKALISQEELEQLLGIARRTEEVSVQVSEDEFPTDDATHAAILATCFDYLDGQLEGDPTRVARALHPDLAKRRVVGERPDEKLGLRRMTKDELVELTEQGVLKTPRDDWNRSCRVLDVKGNIASARVETPWFVDYFHLGQYGERWVIVNALWYSKPKQG